MRIIKALLVLLFLAPTLAAAEPNPESSFLRIQRDESREPVALQTVIAKYVPASGAKGVEIDLVAVVHIGEKAYYERLNKEFEKYDTVLYELVAPEGIKPPKSGEQKSDNPLAMLQQGMKFFLRLEHQLEVVDYGKANFIHADLSPEGLRRAMKERGDDEMTVFLGVVADFLRKKNQGDDKPAPQNSGHQLERPPEPDQVQEDDGPAVRRRRRGCSPRKDGQPAARGGSQQSVHEGSPAAIGGG